jgi:ribonuclease HI
MIKVFYDGSCEPVNPGGNLGAGCVIFDGETKIHEISKFWPAKEENSNNVGEYLALVEGMEWLAKNNQREAAIVFHGDNMMTVKQMNGEWKAKKGLYLEAYRKAKKLREQFKNMRFEWIPREENYLADELSRRK